MRSRAQACETRVARVLRAFERFSGLPAVISAVRCDFAALSVCALSVSVSQSEHGSEVRSPVRHLYQTFTSVRPNHETSILDPAAFARPTALFFCVGRWTVYYPHRPAHHHTSSARGRESSIPPAPCTPIPQQEAVDACGARADVGRVPETVSVPRPALRMRAHVEECARSHAR